MIVHHLTVVIYLTQALENKLNTCQNPSREDQAVRDLYR